MAFPYPNGRLTVCLPVLRKMMRKPSCLISCSHWLPEGSLSVLIGRHGAMNPAVRARIRNIMPIVSDYIRASQSFFDCAPDVSEAWFQRPRTLVFGDEQAEAFYKSKAWNDLAPQRDKAQKVTRRYAVEV